MEKKQKKWKFARHSKDARVCAHCFTVLSEEESFICERCFRELMYSFDDTEGEEE